MPSFSIVIPSRNRADLLKRCLEKVRQRAPLFTEILVVDDGSPEGIIQHVASGFKGVKVIRLGGNGFCQAANAGVKAATGEIVQLLNDDTEVCPGFAEPALEEFQIPQVGAVAPLVLRWPGEINGKAIIDSAGDTYYPSGIAAKRGNGNLLTSVWQVPKEVFGASGSSLFFRKEVFLTLGGFPEEFGGYFEDVDFSFRLHRAGYQIRFQPSSRILHHVSATYGKGQVNRKVLEKQALNEERVFWRNMPSYSLRRWVFPHLLSLVFKAWKRGAEGNLLPFLMGKLRVLFEAKQIMQHRKGLRNQWGPAEEKDWRLESALAPQMSLGPAFQPLVNLCGKLFG